MIFGFLQVGVEHLLAFFGGILRRQGHFSKVVVSGGIVGLSEKMLESRPEDALVKLVKLQRLWRL